MDASEARDEQFQYLTFGTTRPRRLITPVT